MFYLTGGPVGPRQRGSTFGPIFIPSHTGQAHIVFRVFFALRLWIFQKHDIFILQKIHVCSFSYVIFSISARQTRVCRLRIVHLRHMPYVDTFLAPNLI